MSFGFDSNPIASFNATINIDEQQLFESAVKSLKSTQNVINKKGNQLIYTITGDKTQLEKVINEIKSESSKVKIGTDVILNFDKSEFNKNLDRLKKYSGETGAKIGQLLSRELNQAFKDVDVDKIFKELGTTARKSAKEFTRIVQDLESNINGFSFEGELSIGDIDGYLASIKQLKILREQLSGKKTYEKIPFNFDVKQLEKLEKSATENAGKYIKKNQYRLIDSVREQYESEFKQIISMIESLNNADLSNVNKNLSDSFSKLNYDIESVTERIKILKNEISSFDAKKEIKDLEKLYQKYNDLAEDGDIDASDAKMEEFLSKLKRYLTLGGELSALNEDIQEEVSGGYLSGFTNSFDLQSIKDAKKELEQLEIIKQKLENGEEISFGGVNQEDYDLALKKVEELKQKIEELNNELEKNKQGSGISEDDYNNAINAIEEYKQKVEELNAQVEKNKKSSSNQVSKKLYEEEIKKAENYRVKLEELQAKFDKSNKPSNREISLEDLEKAKNEAYDYKKQLEDLTSEYEKQQEQISSMAKNIEELNNQITSKLADGDVEDLSEELSKAQETITQYKNELEEAKKELEKFKDASSDTTPFSKNEEEIQSLIKKVSEYEKQISYLTGNFMTPNNGVTGQQEDSDIINEQNDDLFEQLDIQKDISSEYENTKTKIKENIDLINELKKTIKEQEELVKQYDKQLFSESENNKNIFKQCVSNYRKYDFDLYEQAVKQLSQGEKDEEHYKKAAIYYTMYRGDKNNNKPIYNQDKQDISKELISYGRLLYKDYKSNNVGNENVSLKDRNALVDEIENNKKKIRELEIQNDKLEEQLSGNNDNDKIEEVLTNKDKPNKKSSTKNTSKNKEKLKETLGNKTNVKPEDIEIEGFDSLIGDILDLQGKSPKASIPTSNKKKKATTKDTPTTSTPSTTSAPTLDNEPKDVPNFSGQVVLTPVLDDKFEEKANNLLNGIDLKKEVSIEFKQDSDNKSEKKILPKAMATEKLRVATKELDAIEDRTTEAGEQAVYNYFKAFNDAVESKVAQKTLDTYTREYDSSIISKFEPKTDGKNTTGNSMESIIKEQIEAIKEQGKTVVEVSESQVDSLTKVKEVLSEIRTEIESITTASQNVPTGFQSEVETFTEIKNALSQIRSDYLLFSNNGDELPQGFLSSQLDGLEKANKLLQETKKELISVYSLAKNNPNEPQEEKKPLGKKQATDNLRIATKALDAIEDRGSEAGKQAVYNYVKALNDALEANVANKTLNTYSREYDNSVFLDYEAKLAEQNGSIEGQIKALRHHGTVVEEVSKMQVDSLTNVKNVLDDILKDVNELVEQTAKIPPIELKVKETKVEEKEKEKTFESYEDKKRSDTSYRNEMKYYNQKLRLMKKQADYENTISKAEAFGVDVKSKEVLKAEKMLSAIDVALGHLDDKIEKEGIYRRSNGLDVLEQDGVIKSYVKQLDADLASYKNEIEAKDITEIFQDYDAQKTYKQQVESLKQDAEYVLGNVNLEDILQQKADVFSKLDDNIVNVTGENLSKQLESAKKEVDSLVNSLSVADNENLNRQVDIIKEIYKIKSDTITNGDSEVNNQRLHALSDELKLLQTVGKEYESLYAKDGTTNERQSKIASLVEGSRNDYLKKLESKNKKDFNKQSSASYDREFNLRSEMIDLQKDKYRYQTLVDSNQNVPADKKSKNVLEAERKLESINKDIELLQAKITEEQNFRTSNNLNDQEKYLEFNQKITDKSDEYLTYVRKIKSENEIILEQEKEALYVYAEQIDAMKEKLELAFQGVESSKLNARKDSLISELDNGIDSINANNVGSKLGSADGKVNKLINDANNSKSESFQQDAKKNLDEQVAVLNKIYKLKTDMLGLEQGSESYNKAQDELRVLQHKVQALYKVSEAYQEIYDSSERLKYIDEKTFDSKFNFTKAYDKESAQVQKIINQTMNKLKAYADTDGKVSTYGDFFNQSYEKIQQLNKNFSNEGLDGLEKYKHQLNAIFKLLKSNSWNDNGNVITTVSSIEEAENALNEYIDSLGKAQLLKTKYTNAGIEYIVQQRTEDDVINQIVVSYDKLSKSMSASLQSSVQGMNNLDSFLDVIKKKMIDVGKYLISFVGVFATWDTLKTGMSYAREFDSVLTELKSVVGDANADMGEFSDRALEVANSLGISTTEVIRSATDWRRLGYDVEKSIDLTKEASKLSTAGFMDMGIATDTLTSALQAFYSDSDDIAGMASQVVDKFVHIGNEYAITSQDLADSMTDASSTLVAAGNDIDQVIALITAGTTIMQDADQVAASLRVVSMRLRGTSEDDLIKLGEDTEGLIEDASKLNATIQALTKTESNPNGIRILTDSGAYRSTYDILLDISRIWKEIGETEGGDMKQANGLPVYIEIYTENIFNCW